MKTKINIVLYSPEIPQNTGNISRTCAVTGASLHIIKPIGFEISDRTLKRAGLDYWDKLDLHYYDSFEEFEQAHPFACMYFFSSHARRLYTEIEPKDEVFLVFGKESSGLDPELVRERIDTAVRIPMLDGCRCLNLSNSVAVAVYELLRRDGFSGMRLVGDIGE
ncbi:MAG: tRNA (cytidine(34)-2'-O)-methyltransferase [Clostridia bacterium]|nr:tRNA (cytidine(34)-2'-O)-methyltransferase [Clostridia bacterium]